jgi:hypothetical protein
MQITISTINKGLIVYINDTFIDLKLGKSFYLKQPFSSLLICKITGAMNA